MTVLSLFSGNMSQMILSILVRAFVLVAILPVHEFAHAYMAHKLGDDTGKWSGRMTLNPGAHLDPFGSLMILLVGIGWAKPVPVNPRNFKNPKSGMAITALAGPVSNLIMGFLAMLVLRLVSFIPMTLVVWQAISFFFTTLASINISLAVFNLLPCPPLDGSRIVSYFLPDKWNFKIQQYERYIWIGLMVLLVVGVLDWPLAFLGNKVTNGLWWLVNLPFKALGLV